MDLTGTHRLGARAFLLFLSRRVKWLLIFLGILVALWTQKEKVPIGYRDWSDYGLNLLFYIWVGFLVFIFLRSFFEYRGYSFRFDEEFFNVTRGYFVKHEMGIVYHQIQHVTVRQGILDRAVGVGHLIIVTNVGGDKSLCEVTLPALDKNKARFIQRELLRMARGSTVTRSRTSRSRNVSSDADAEDMNDAEETEDGEDKE